VASGAAILSVCTTGTKGSAAVVRGPLLRRIPRMFNHISVSSRDALLRQGSARPRITPVGAPGTRDATSRSDTLAHRSVVLSDDGAGRTHRQFAVSALSVGNLLYLTSLGLVAAAIIGVFFSTGFLLLEPPAGGTLSGSATRNTGSGVQSLVYGFSPLSESDHQPANGRPGPAVVKTPTPGSGDQTSSSVLPPPPRPAADEKPPQEKNEMAQSSAELLVATPPPPISAKDIPTHQEAQAGSPASKVAHRAPAEAPDPAPSSLAAPSPAVPNTSLSTAEVTELLAHGDALLHTGDIASARLFYERAAAAGDGRAALRLGATFDPAFLGSAGLRNVQGDAAEARSWYSRALDLGAAEAKRQLNSIETKQGR
jgi:hypothetical protein